MGNWTKNLFDCLEPLSSQIEVVLNKVKGNQTKIGFEQVESLRIGSESGT